MLDLPRGARQRRDIGLIRAGAGPRPQDEYANGPLVPRVRNTSKKRDREEPAAPPAAPPPKRVSAPPPRERDGLDLDRTAAYLL